MRELIKKIPIIRTIARLAYQKYLALRQPFTGSEDYWKQRYEAGGNSGAGSYSKFADFKARILNDFVDTHQVTTVIEYGCGDGNQLKLANYPSYIGFDVSPQAISQCERLFSGDATKAFKLMEPVSNDTAELTLSLDVIYHLIEDDVFASYIERLLDTSKKFVIIYASNTDEQVKFQSAHVKNRKFSNWIDKHRPEWKLTKHIPNEYPYAGNENTGTFADFYIYQKT